ncbi:MAG: ImpA family type VI secretion system protein, partial [Rhizobiaceae bacterium]
MRFEKLREPISKDQPCGPDLDEEGDEDYINYIFAAEERLPTRFFDDEQKPFDKSGIDLDDEVKTIGELLERSRDLRLLTLEARFQILRGEIIGFCECVTACTQLTEKFWNHVHPGADGDMQLRQNTVASLDSLITCVLPMQFAPIVRDRREGDISYRVYAVATGDVTPAEEEKVKSPAAVTDALGNAGNSEVVEATFNALNEMIEAFEKLKSIFIEHVDHEFVPFFDQITEAAQQLIKLIGKARPDLAGEKSTDDDETGDERENEEDSTDIADGSTPAAAAGADAQPGKMDDVPSHSAAQAA